MPMPATQKLPHWGDAAKNLGAALIGQKQRIVEFTNLTTVPILLVLAEEDFEMQVQVKKEAAGGGFGFECISSKTNKSLKPMHHVLEPLSARGPSIHAIPVSLNVSTYIKFFSKNSTDTNWETAPLIKHYEGVLIDHSPEVVVKPSHLKHNLGEYRRRPSAQKKPAQQKPVQPPAPVQTPPSQMVH